MSADQPAQSPPSIDASPALRWQAWFWPSLAMVLIGDQITKWWLFALPVRGPFSEHSPGTIEGFPGWIERSYNTGVAWGLGRHWPGLVALVTALLVPALAWIWWRYFRLLGRWENLAFGAILGGAIGNGIDRGMSRLGQLQGVRDFIMVDLRPIGIDYTWPTFNLADAGICCGFIVLALLALAKPKVDSPAPRARVVV